MTLSPKVREALDNLATDHETLQREYNDPEYPRHTRLVEQCKAEVEKSESALVAAISEQVRAEEREKAAAEAVAASDWITYQMYAPLVAAVREWREARKAWFRESNSDARFAAGADRWCHTERLRLVAAEKALQALALPGVTKEGDANADA